MSHTPSEAGAHVRGAALVISGAMCWSIGGVISRAITTDAWTTAFWRALSCAAFMLIFLAVEKRGRLIQEFRAAGWAGLLAGACIGTASTCFVAALEFTTVATISVIQTVLPFVAALLAFVIMGERVPRRTWLAIVVAVGGLALMISGGPKGDGVIGILFSFLMIFAFSGATVTMRYHREVRTTSAVSLGLLMAAGVTLPFASVNATPQADIPWLLAFGMVQLGMGLILFTRGAPHVPAAQTSLLTLVEAILGPAWVWIFFDEEPETLVLAGGALVLSALVGHALLDLRDARRMATGLRPDTPPASKTLAAGDRTARTV